MSKFGLSGLAGPILAMAASAVAVSPVLQRRSDSVWANLPEAFAPPGMIGTKVLAHAQRKFHRERLCR